MFRIRWKWLKRDHLPFADLITHNARVDADVCTDVVEYLLWSESLTTDLVNSSSSARRPRIIAESLGPFTLISVLLPPMVIILDPQTRNIYRTSVHKIFVSELTESMP